jgi:hypothetical protein
VEKYPTRPVSCRIVSPAADLSPRIERYRRFSRYADLRNERYEGVLAAWRYDSRLLLVQAFLRASRRLRSYAPIVTA